MRGVLGIALAVAVFVPGMIHHRLVESEAQSLKWLPLSTASSQPMPSHPIDSERSINYAYSMNLSPRQLDTMIKGGPTWASADGFEVEAKAEDSSVTVAQLREMLQNLLADRFRIQVHRETKEVPGYALVIAKKWAEAR